MRRCPQCGTEYPNEVAFCGHDGTITIAVLPAGTTPDARLGARLGEYVVVAPVADGAMGRVYEGRHIESKKRVAVKVLHEDVAKDRIAVERFKREYETARDIDSKYIVRVIDFGETPDRSFFLTMEYLEGQELGNLVRGSGAQSVGRAVHGEGGDVARVRAGDIGEQFGHRALPYRAMKSDQMGSGVQIRSRSARAAASSWPSTSRR